MQKEWTHTANGRDKDAVEAEAEVKRAKGRKGGRGEGQREAGHSNSVKGRRLLVV